MAKRQIHLTKFVEKRNFLFEKFIRILKINAANGMVFFCLKKNHSVISDCFQPIYSLKVGLNFILWFFFPLSHNRVIICV